MANHPPTHSPQPVARGWALYEKSTGKIFQWSNIFGIYPTKKIAGMAAREYLTTWGRAYQVLPVRITPKYG